MSDTRDAPTSTDGTTIDAKGGMLRPVLMTALAATLTAVVAALVLDLAGLDLRVPVQPGGDDLQSLALGAVAIAAAVATLVGGAVYTFLRGRTARPARAWAVLVAVVVVLSLAPVVAVGAGTANAVGLGILHVLVGAVVALGLPRLAGDATTSGNVGGTA